ncbi:MAG: DUF2399 domain-containing protein [Mycobacteriales bacterium]
MTELSEGLRQWCAFSGPNKVISAVRTRARRGYSTESGVLRIELAAEQRREVGKLLGSRWAVTDATVNLRSLTKALAEHGLTTRKLVELLDGESITNERLARAENLAAAATERVAAASELARLGVAADAADLWLTDTGLPRAGNGELLSFTTQVATVWQALPDPGTPTVRLAQLAASVLSKNAHTLDYSEQLGRMAARLIALHQGLARPTRAGRDWRRAWGVVNVRCDGVSSRVLTLNLPLTGTASAAAQSTASPGEPTWLTLRSLDGQWTVSAASIFVCENVTVLEAAADELGTRCPPMVCTDGNASLAAQDLIMGLAAAGCALQVRADIDTAGLGIVANILELTSDTASLWRFDSSTYATATGTNEAHQPTSSVPGEFNRLRDLHAAHGVDVHEESLLDDLLADLALLRFRL